jgi:hypothetical protein
MKLSDISSVSSIFKKMSSKELLVIIVFVLYIILPVSTPACMVDFINSSIGLVFIFIFTLIFFVKGSPVLGILFIFVAYEILRRSSITGNYVLNEQELTQYMPNAVPTTVISQQEKDVDMQTMNPVSSKTLEEEMVEIRAPIGGSALSSYLESSYKPVVGSLQGVSMF